MRNRYRNKNIANRLKIAFFDFPDVFEDFYSHYGVDHESFATTWHNTGSHAWLKIIQQEIGDVTWYALSLEPRFKEAVHNYTGVKVVFIQSSIIHRFFWKLFYTSRVSKKLQRFYKIYASVASYSSLLSRRIYKTVKKDKPDIILAQEYSSGRFDMLHLYARRMKIPILTYHAGSTIENYSGRYLRKFTIRKSQWIFASGEAELERLHSTYKIPKKKLNIIRPPVDISIYKPMDKTECCKAAGLEINKRYWIFVGRLDDTVKRVSSIINNFAVIASENKNIDLLIIGSGNDGQKLITQSLEVAKDRIHFFGWVTQDLKKAVYYNCAEMLVMASKREGFPTVIGEAFACGIPVLSSNVGTISDLVLPGKTGWLFPAGDDKCMLDLMRTIASDLTRTGIDSNELRKMAEEHVSFEAVTTALKQGFNSLKTYK